MTMMTLVTMMTRMTMVTRMRMIANYERQLTQVHIKDGLSSMPRYLNDNDDK